MSRQTIEHTTFSLHKQRARACLKKAFRELQKPAGYIHLYLTGLFYLIPPGAFPAFPGIKKLPQLDSNQRHCG